MPGHDRFQPASWQISGGEDWMYSAWYDVEAKPSEEMRASIRTLEHGTYSLEDEHLRQMLQALLLERFQLQFHRVTKSGTVYRLERNGKPLGLRPAAAEARPGGFRFAAGLWSLRAVSMAELAKYASDYVLRAPVEDRTGLSGRFDYQQHAADPDPDSRDDRDRSWLNCLTESGLKLQRAKGPVQTFVIDHASRPTPN